MIFRNKLVSLLDATFDATSSAFNAMGKVFDEIDAETQIANLEEKGSKLFSGLNGLLRQIRENSDLYVVRVPFDQEKEEYTYTIENSQLIVSKTSETNNTTSYSETKATIPAECDIENMKVSYSEKKHLLAFVFPKNKK